MHNTQLPFLSYRGVHLLRMRGDIGWEQYWSQLYVYLGMFKVAQLHTKCIGVYIVPDIHLPVLPT